MQVGGTPPHLPSGIAGAAKHAGQAAAAAADRVICVRAGKAAFSSGWSSVQEGFGGEGRLQTRAIELTRKQPSPRQGRAHSATATGLTAVVWQLAVQRHPDLCAPGAQLKLELISKGQCGLVARAAARDALGGRGAGDLHHHACGFRGEEAVGAVPRGAAHLCTVERGAAWQSRAGLVLVLGMGAGAKDVWVQGVRAQNPAVTF